MNGARQVLIGSKEVIRYLMKGEPMARVIIAKDAQNTEALNKIKEQCQKRNIEISYIDSKKELGEKAKIDVNAAVVALLI